MLRAIPLLSFFCLLSICSASAHAQPGPPARPAPVDPIAYQNELRLRIARLAQREHELKRAGQPPGYNGQLITAAALAATGVVTAGGALTAGYVSAFSSSTDLNYERLDRLMIAGAATVGVAGLWAIVLTTVRKLRTNRREMLRLREERRDLKAEYQRVQHGYYGRVPLTLSLLLERQQVGLRAKF